MYNAIDREELKTKMDNNENFVLVEVLDEEDFKKEHIKGAVNLPLRTIGKEIQDRFEKDKEIVVYCSDSECGASPAAAKKLDSLGYKNVYDYEAGKKDWKDAGYPMESE